MQLTDNTWRIGDTFLLEITMGVQVAQECDYVYGTNTKKGYKGNRLNLKINVIYVATVLLISSGSLIP